MGRLGPDGGINDENRLEFPEAQSGGLIGPPGPQRRGCVEVSADDVSAPGKGISPLDIRPAYSLDVVLRRQ